MEEYVLDLGIVAFISWWQFAFWLSLVALYLVFNVFPALLVLYCSVRWPSRWQDIFLEFELFLLCLIPFIGSLVGGEICKEWEPYETTAHILFVAYFITFVGMVIQGC